MKTNRLTTRLLPLLAAFALLGSAHAQTSAVPDYISYQGRALNADGSSIGAETPVNRMVTFRVWDHASSNVEANLLYSEQQMVTISNGEFSVLIGAGAATVGSQFGYDETSKGVPANRVSSPIVFGAATRYLGVTIDDGTAAADSEISPRQQFVSTTFAFRAKVAETVENSAITTAMMANNSVTSVQINDNSILSTDIQDGTITSLDIADNSITTADLQNDIIYGNHIADGSIESRDIADNSISAADLQNDIIYGNHIADGSIESRDILDGSILSQDIANNTIWSDDIMDGGIHGHDILDETIQSVDIRDGAVTSLDIAENTIQSNDIKDGTIRGEDMGERTINSLETLRIVSGSVNDDGSRLRGAGFLVQRIDVDGVEQYHITFDPPFAGVPVVTATMVGSNYNIISIRDNTRTDKVIIDAHVNNVGWNPLPFNFIAIGPR